MRKKKWVKPFLDENTKYLIDSIPITNKPIYMEIGMGMGDFICESAKMNQDVFYIGLEKDETCVARAIKKAEEYELNNFKIMLLNADKIIETIKENTISCIYLHFSDPWPKKSHHKRRLTYPTFLNVYEKILVNNGSLIMKTDNIGLFEDSLEYFSESKFKQIEINRDYHSELINEPMTAYQRKFSELGQPIYFVKLVISK